MSEDYKGKEFGRWQVIDTAPSYVWVSKDGLKSQRHKQLLCQCSCGKIQVVRKQYLLRGTSQFKYVYFHKQHKKWICSLTVEGKPIHLGTFGTEEDAAKVVYKYYYEVFGEWPPYTEKDREVLNL